MGDRRLDAALDLLHRLPPQQITTNVTKVAHLQPHLLDDVTSAIDQPLQTARDPCTGRDYVTSEYNRHDDCHRSPWCNKFHPPTSAASGARNLRGWMRQLEADCNDAFSRYLSMYYDGGVSSAYFWSLNDDVSTEDDVTASSAHFAAAIFFKKTGAPSGGGGGRHSRVASTQGSWDSTHIVEIKRVRRAQADDKHRRSSSSKTARSTKGAAGTDDVTQEIHYTMTSSIMLWLQTNKHVSGLMNIGGSLGRQSERRVQAHTAATSKAPRKTSRTSSKSSAVQQIDAVTPAQLTSHVVTLGEMVEEAENTLRQRLAEIYFWRTKDIILRHLRCADTVTGAQHARRQSRMLDVADLKQVREEMQIRRSPSGKHLLVQAGPSMVV